MRSLSLQDYKTDSQEKYLIQYRRNIVNRYFWNSRSDENSLEIRPNLYVSVENRSWGAAACLAGVTASGSKCWSLIGRAPPPPSPLIGSHKDWFAPRTWLILGRERWIFGSSTLFIGFTETNMYWSHVLCYIEPYTWNMTGNDLLAEAKIYYKRFVYTGTFFFKRP